MDGLRLVGPSLLELDRRNAVQQFDLDAIVATNGQQLYLRSQGRFSARTAAIRVEGTTLVAIGRHSKRPIAIDLVAAGILDKELGIVGIPQSFLDAGCQTTLPLARRSIAKGRVPADLLVDLDLAERDRRPLWMACNTSEQLACVLRPRTRLLGRLRYLGLAERELLRETYKATPHILAGYLEGDKMKPGKLKIDRSGFLRTPAALVTGASCLYAPVFDAAWTRICDLASDSASARSGFVRAPDRRR